MKRGVSRMQGGQIRGDPSLCKEVVELSCPLSLIFGAVLDPPGLLLPAVSSSSSPRCHCHCHHLLPTQSPSPSRCGWDFLPTQLGPQRHVPGTTTDLHVSPSRSLPTQHGRHGCSPAQLCFHSAPLFVCVHADVPIDLLTATHPAAKSKVFPSSRCQRSPRESFCNPLSPLAARQSGPYPCGVQPFGGWFKSHGAAFIQKLVRSCPSPPVSRGSQPWAACASADACCSSGCPLPGAAQALGTRRASKIHVQGCRKVERGGGGGFCKALVYFGKSPWQ